VLDCLGILFRSERFEKTEFYEMLFLFEDASRGLLGCDPEDGGSMTLLNTGILPDHYTVS